ncbi:M13 family metallopeptidase [Anaeromyxobacter diazotrophicus]|uniref:Metallopeptidase n=1 Tax=Anaeromyxobacter diazotrophicus TaxID=2590199 RepID=A0A7I9VQG6_9BACT|nr:M13 family metallopeptidase [Anaeromyxobacter diazotrophicus]GEJ58654.1 metallopeptidase [Anaeromyxobacter diazotrophicus]
MTARPPLAALALAAALHAPSARAAGEAPLTRLPYTPGLDPAAMDRAADPCVDFYAFACGGWLAKNPIPPDESRWGVYGKLAHENRQLLWGLLEEAARPGPSRGDAARQAGDYFAACMDEGAVERAGAAPLEAELRQVRALRSKRSLAALLGRLQPSLGDELAFDLSSEQDMKDATRVLAVLSAGGLGLPDRDYYLKDDARSEEIRARYASYLEGLLRLAGEPPEAARAGARTALRLETALARAALSRVDKRDPYRVYHRLGLGQLQALTPSFDWRAYLAAAGAPRLRVFNVTEPAFFLELEARLAEEPLEAWRTYLVARLADARAPYLSRPFQEAHFAFHGAFLEGVKEDRARWKKCVAWVDRDLGEALGQLFVARAFAPAVKAQVEDLTRRVERAMARRIAESPWMTPATQRAALAKLALLRNKIGYPARWRDYRRLRLDRGDFFGNVARTGRFETARQLAKVGRPVDREAWDMTAPTVNAYYNPQLNDMNFPAGVLLPPLWDPSLDLAPGYGNTGGTIGHELTHAFDDEGRQFDGRGNLRGWWTPEDAAEFERRTACLVEQFGRYPAVDEVKVNSRLTVGEDVADLGGTTLAYLAWQEATRGQPLAPRDGLTPAQRFFVGNAQWACENETDEAKRVHAVTDAHSPPRWRVNGLFANMPEFREAFACRAGQPMAPEHVCRVW